MKILNYINFINQTIHENNSSLSFYKINERAKDGETVKPWPEADLVKFRLLNKDSEANLKAYFKEKFFQAIDELLTKNPNLYIESSEVIKNKLEQKFIQTKTRYWTYNEIGGWIKTRWSDKVFNLTTFITEKDKTDLTGFEESIWHKEYHVLNGRKSSDEIMSNYFYNYGAAGDKLLDSESAVISGYDHGLDYPEGDYWKNRVTKIINDRNINNDEEYKKIFKLINGVTTDFQDLQWKIQGEFISLYVYFMLRLYANAIAKDIDKVDPKKLKEKPSDDTTTASTDTTAVSTDTTTAAPQVKKRKRFVSSKTRDIESIRKIVGSRLD